MAWVGYGCVCVDDLTLLLLDRLWEEYESGRFALLRVLRR